MKAKEDSCSASLCFTLFHSALLCRDLIFDDEVQLKGAVLQPHLAQERHSVPVSTETLQIGCGTLQKVYL